MMKRKRTCGARNPFYVTPSLNEKYSRQMLFAGIGPEGQARLAGSSAVIFGCVAIGAAVASLGRTFTIRPEQPACLACLLETGGAPGLEETCDTVGVLGPIVNLIASLEAAEALKLLSGNESQLHGRLLSWDVWTGRFQSLEPERNPRCRACALREFPYLEGQAQPHITMCGRDSVQIHERGRKLDLPPLEQRLASSIPGVRQNGFLLRFQVAPYEMTIFSDGRAILKGTKDPAVARSLYAKYIGA